MDCLWFREKLSPNFLSAALPLLCRCGVEVVYSVVGTRTRGRHPAPGQVHCLVICIRPATSTAGHSRAPASLVRPTLHGHWCSVWTDALPIIWLLELVLASAPAIGLQQCTGGAQHNPDIATRSHAQDGYMLVFSPLLLERPNLNTVYLYSHATCNVLSLYILVLSTFFKIFRPIHQTKVQ